MNLTIQFLLLLLINNTILYCTMKQNPKSAISVILLFHSHRAILTFLTSMFLTSIIEELFFSMYLSQFLDRHILSLVFGIYHLPMLYVNYENIKNNFILACFNKLALTSMGGYFLFSVYFEHSIYWSIIIHTLYNILLLLSTYVIAKCIL